MSVYGAELELNCDQVELIHDYVENNNPDGTEPIELGEVYFEGDENQDLHAIVWLDDGIIDTSIPAAHLYAQFLLGDDIVGGATIDWNDWETDRVVIPEIVDDSGEENSYNVILVSL